MLFAQNVSSRACGQKDEETRKDTRGSNQLMMAKKQDRHTITFCRQELYSLNNAFIKGKEKYINLANKEDIRTDCRRPRM